MSEPMFVNSLSMERSSVITACRRVARGSAMTSVCRCRGPRPLPRTQEPSQLPIVTARQQQLTAARSHESREHVPPCVPHVALRPEEILRRLAPGKRGPPLDELVTGADRQRDAHREKEQPRATL